MPSTFWQGLMLGPHIFRQMSAPWPPVRLDSAAELHRFGCHWNSHGTRSSLWTTYRAPVRETRAQRRAVCRAAHTILGGVPCRSQEMRVVFPGPTPEVALECTRSVVRRTVFECAGRATPPVQRLGDSHAVRVGSLEQGERGRGGIRPTASRALLCCNFSIQTFVDAVILRAERCCGANLPICSDHLLGFFHQFWGGQGRWGGGSHTTITTGAQTRLALATARVPAPLRSAPSTSGCAQRIG